MLQEQTKSQLLETAIKNEATNIINKLFNSGYLNNSIHQYTAEITNRISQLNNNPSFCELCDFINDLQAFVNEGKIAVDEINNMVNTKIYLEKVYNK